MSFAGKNNLIIPDNASDLRIGSSTIDLQAAFYYRYYYGYYYALQMVVGKEISS